MKFKNILTVTFAAMTVGAISSCDNISDDDRYLAIEEPSVPEEPSTPDEPGTDLIKPAPRVAFLEEFTGQKCLNCPTAHGIISSLKEGYGDKFVPVSIHYATTGDAFNYPAGSLLSLVTDDGNYYASKWNIVSLPTGTVDMTTLTDMGQWGSQVRSIVSETAPVGISLTAEIVDGSVVATAELAAAEAVSGTLLIWLCESGVKAPQLQPDGTTIMAYEHNHILRGAIGSREGKAINLERQTTTTVTESLDLSKVTVRNNDNLSVVAFIMKDSWRNVIQAAEFDFTPHAAE